MSEDTVVVAPVSQSDLADYIHLSLDHGITRATMYEPHQLAALHDDAHAKGHGHLPGTIARYGHGVGPMPRPKPTKLAPVLRLIPRPNKRSDPHRVQSCRAGAVEHFSWCRCPRCEP